jgi:hypothetical protein
MSISIMISIIGVGFFLVGMPMTEGFSPSLNGVSSFNTFTHTPAHTEAPIVTCARSSRTFIQSIVAPKFSYFALAMACDDEKETVSFKEQDSTVSEFQPPFSFPIIKGTEETSLYDYIIDKKIPISFTNSSGLGNFVSAVQGQEAVENQYWALYLNGAFANFGVDDLKVKEGDYIFFMLRTFTPSGPPPLIFTWVIDGDNYCSFYDYATKKEVDFVYREKDLPKHFVICINTLCKEPSDETNEYWALYINGTLSGKGIDDLSVKKGDIVQFVPKNLKYV